MSIAESLQGIGFLTAFRESQLMYPIILSTHLACIAVFGGMILMTDLRLMGIALTKFSVSEVVGRFRMWKRVGFCVMIFAGLLLGCSEAVKYSPNPFFWIKMVLLVFVGVHALAFRPTVYNNTEAIDRSPALPTNAKIAGALSIVIWLGILSMGRLIAYYEGGAKPSPTSVALFKR